MPTENLLSTCDPVLSGPFYQTKPLLDFHIDVSSDSTAKIPLTRNLMNSNG